MRDRAGAAAEQAESGDRRAEECGVEKVQARSGRAVIEWCTADRETDLSCVYKGIQKVLQGYRLKSVNLKEVSPNCQQRSDNAGEVSFHVRFSGLSS